jgi:hypothetical protein
MAMRTTALVITAIVPGLAAALASGYYLFPDWAALDNAHRNLDRVAQSNPSVQALIVAQAAEERHRINCFAEGMGVLVGGVWMAIGVHGICTMPRSGS